MADKRKVLFLCTGNSCRSQMAEAILGHLAGDRFEALSAGSNPAGFIHGLALDAMDVLDIPVDAQESKSWNVFADVRLDVVITLCDSAAAEQCPVWPGDPLTVHWSTPDPAFHPGTLAERLDFAVTVAHRLRDKIQGLIDMDWSAPPIELMHHLERLAEI